MAFSSPSGLKGQNNIAQWQRLGFPTQRLGFPRHRPGCVHIICDGFPGFSHFVDQKAWNSFHVATVITTNSIATPILRAPRRKGGKTPGPIPASRLSVQSASPWSRWRRSAKPAVGVRRLHQFATPGKEQAGVNFPISASPHHKGKPSFRRSASERSSCRSAARLA